MDLGGSEQQTCLLLNHLDRNQFQPHLYLTYRRGDLLDRVPADVPIEAFDDHSFSTRVNWPGRWHARMVRHLKELLTRWEIDVVYDRTFHMTMIAAPACGRRIGRVSTIVCPPHQDLPNSEHRFLEWKRSKLKRAYEKSVQVIAVSEAVKKSAVEYYGLPAERVEILRSPVDTEALKLAAKSPAPDWFKPAAINVLCVGRMTREKGQDVLIEAVKLLRDKHQAETADGDGNFRYKFWLIGDGPLKLELDRMVLSYHLSDHVLFPGRTSQVASLMAGSDVMVCPSRYEGLPNVILEAMALRLPVIASNVGGIPEIVRDQQTGMLVPPDNPASLAEKLLKLGRNPNEFQTTAKVAEAFVASSFSLPSYLQLIGECLKMAKRSN